MSSEENAMKKLPKMSVSFLCVHLFLNYNFCERMFTEIKIRGKKINMLNQDWIYQYLMPENYEVSLNNLFISQLVSI